MSVFAHVAHEASLRSC